MKNKDISNHNSDTLSDVNDPEDEEEKVSQQSPDGLLKRDIWVNGLQFYPQNEDNNNNFDNKTVERTSETYLKNPQELFTKRKTWKSSLNNSYIIDTDHNELEDIKDDNELQQDPGDQYISLRAHQASSSTHLKYRDNDPVVSAFPLEPEENNPQNPDSIFHTETDEKNQSGKNFIPPISKKIQDEVFHQEEIKDQENIGEEVVSNNEAAIELAFFKKHKKKIIITSGILITLIAMSILLGILLVKILNQPQKGDIDTGIDPFVNDPVLSKFMSIDPVSQNPIIKYPISKDQYLAAIKSPLLKTIPIKFDLNEQCNFTVNITFKLESDALNNSPANGKYQTTFYNASFYTTNIQKDQLTILVQYFPIADDTDSGNTQDSNSNSIDEVITDQAVIEWAKGELESLNNETDFMDNDKFDSLGDEEKLKYLYANMKIAKCDLNFYGTITACSFIANMTTDEQALAIKLVRMYIPSLNKTHYQKKQRLLPELEIDNSSFQDLGQSGVISEQNGAISHQLQSNDSQDDGSVSSNVVDNSDHILDLNTGKIGTSSKSEGESYKPSPIFSANETTISYIKSDSLFSAKMISKVILSQSEMDEKLSELKDLNLIVVQTPEITLFSLQPSSNTDSLNQTNNNGTDRLLSERNLASSFSSINLKIFTKNLLFVTITGNYKFECTTDDYCKQTFTLQPSSGQPLTVSTGSNAQLGTTLKKYRYIKLMFQNNIDNMKSLTVSLQKQIDIVVADNFKALDSELNKFQKPIVEASYEFGNYTDNILQKTTNLSESLDIPNSMNDVLNLYLNERIDTVLGSVYSEINVAASGFQDILLDYQSIVINSDQQKFSSTYLANLSIQKYQVLSLFDKLLSDFESEWNNFMASNLEIFSNTYSYLFNLKSSSLFTSNFDNSKVDLVFNSVLDQFDSLKSTFKSSLSNLKDGAKLQVYLYHARQRESIEAILDKIITYVNESATGTNQLEPIDTTTLSNFISLVDVKFDPLKLTEDTFTNILREIETMIIRDVYKSLYNINQLSVLSDQNSQMVNISSQLTKSIAAINKTISDNLTAIATNTLNKFNTQFSNINFNLQNLPSTIDKQFNDNTAMNNFKEYTTELKNIATLIKELKLIMDNFYTLVDVVNSQKTYISTIQKNFKKVTNETAILDQKYNKLITQIKAIESQFQITINKPANPFKNLVTDLQTIEKGLENQVKTYGIQPASEKVKGVGSNFGTTFINSLNSKLETKLLSIIPYKQKTTLSAHSIQWKIPKQKRILGALITSMPYIIIEPALKQYIEYASGNYHLTSELYIYVKSDSKMEVNYGKYKLSTSITDTLVEGTIATKTTVLLQSLKPSLLTQSIFARSNLLQWKFIYQSDQTVSYRTTCHNHWGNRRCRTDTVYGWTAYRYIGYQAIKISNGYQQTILSPTMNTMKLL